jgi:hypothetical protein
MRALKKLRVSLRGAGRLALLFGGAYVFGACAPEFDDARVSGPKGTLGDDVFGVFCDRVGATSLAEDLEGASYRGICHFDAQGNYKSKVDASALPPPSTPAEKASRKLAIAKLDAMVRRRADFIRAIDAILPDTKINDVVAGSGQIRLHDALEVFSQGLEPLYDSNPFEKNGEPIMPGGTRAIGRLFGSIAKNEDARNALSRIWGRKGYRPFQVGLGAMRPALAYPQLRPMAHAALTVLGPGGPGSAQLDQVLAVAKQELLTSAPVIAPLPPVTLDAAKAQPSRPRTNLEVLANVFLAQDDAFNETGDSPRYIAQRDRRGFAVPAMNVPGMKGSVPAPFSDVDGDGFADVDAFGRFLDAQNAPLDLEPPFAIPGVTQGTPDAFGRLGGPWTYLDTSRALTGALARHTLPLVDATQYGQAGDPNAWQSDHETMMFALAGARVLFGDREPAQYDYAASAIRGMNEGCDGCLPYTRFRGEDSPFVGLTHALGQVLADKDSDAILISLMDLLEHHEDVVARLVGAALKVREISLAHDALAAKGSEPKAELAYNTPLWDEMAQIVARITARPGLLEKLVNALAQDDVVTPHGASKHMGETLAAFSSSRDEMTYDQFNMNGPCVNVTDGSGTADPHNPVDLKKPKAGKNTSLMQRSLMVIHDARNAKACNKQGAVVKADLFGLTVDWPLVGDYNECELISFDNEALFYLDANLPAGHPKRSLMNIKSSTLNSIMSFLGALGQSPDDLMISSSGIDGLSLHPEARALTRLLFFGATSDNYPNMPDHDSVGQGSKTDNFVHAIIEPVGGISCPTNGNAVNTCPTPADTLRVRDGGIMFAWERLGFLDYLKPLIRVFANESCASDESSCDLTDTSGEQIFVDLLDELWYHWPAKDHGPECSPTGNRTTNTKWCSEAGLNRYEPIIVDGKTSDLIPALHEFAKAARDLSHITVARGPHAGEVWSGGKVLEKMTRILFDPTYAASVGMVDRSGSKAAKWVDGTPQPQLTVFTLFADALHGMDQRFDSAAAACSGDQACAADVELRRGQWHRARSQFVDVFLGVDGLGQGAKFQNKSFAKMSLAIMRTLREQLNANCPDRENGTGCQWARKDLGDKVAEVLSGPVFAGLMDVQESVRADENARRQLEAFLQYVMTAASQGDALQSTLASMSDIVQVLSDDANMSPIFNAVSVAANPAHDKDGTGLAAGVLRQMMALTDDRFDRYHVVDAILPNLVTPMNDSSGLSPLEVLLDVFAEVNRTDSALPDPLQTADYQDIMGTMRDFMLDDTRGLEQIYTILKNRPRE